MIGLPCPSEIAEHTDDDCETSALENNEISMRLSEGPNLVCLDVRLKSEA